MNTVQLYGIKFSGALRLTICGISEAGVQIFPNGALISLIEALVARMLHAIFKRTAFFWAP